MTIFGQQAPEHSAPGQQHDGRHINDLHLMQGHIDPGQVAALARDIAAADAREFRNQYPAYAADIAGETRKALDALRTDAAYRTRYDDFIIAMSYGERPEFDVALRTVVVLAEQTIQHEGNGTC